MYNSLQPLGLQHSRLPCPSLHHLPEVAQTYIHWVSDAIQPSQSLSSPSPPAFNLSQHQGLHWTGFSHQVADILELQFQHQSFQWIFKGDFTEHLLNCSRRPWTPNMTRKISMQLGRMKERKKRKEEMGRTSMPCGKLRWEVLQKSPFTAGESAGEERNVQGITGGS